MPKVPERPLSKGELAEQERAHYNRQRRPFTDWKGGKIKTTPYEEGIVQEVNRMQVSDTDDLEYEAY